MRGRRRIYAENRPNAIKITCRSRRDMLMKYTALCEIHGT